MLCYVHCRFSYVTLGDLNCLDRVFCSGVHFLQDWLMIPLKMIYGTIWFVSSFCNFVSRVTGVPREVYPSTGCKKSRDAPPGVTPRTSPEPPPRPLPPIRRPINYPWLLARRHARAASGSTWNVAINEEEIFDAHQMVLALIPLHWWTQSFILPFLADSLPMDEEADNVRLTPATFWHRRESHVGTFDIIGWCISCHPELHLAFGWLVHS